MHGMILKTKQKEMTEKILKTISYSGTREVLYCLALRDCRFSELVDGTKLNPGALSRLLKALIEVGFVTRNSDRYALTEKGKHAIKFTKDFFNIFQ